MISEAEVPNANPMVLIFTHLRSIAGILYSLPHTILFSLLTIAAGASGLHDLASTLVRTWSRVLLAFFGIKFEIKNADYLPEKGGGIIVFNHQSHFDIPLLMNATTKRIRFGAKIELFKIPFFGTAMRAIGTLPIARENRSEVLRIYKEAHKRFEENFIFVLAPEGTRQNQPQIGRFKKGPFIFAIEANVPLIPVVIKGAYEVLPKDGKGVNLGKISRLVKAEFLPPMDISKYSRENVDQLVSEVREQMVQVYNRL